MNSRMFLYEGYKVTFTPRNKNIMVNATEMAKPFKKKIADWLLIQQTNDYIKELSAFNNCGRKNLVIIENNDTWMQEDVAIEFARWLNSKFSMWCNDRVKLLMKIGFTTSSDKLDKLINNPDLLIRIANSLKREKAQKEKLSQELENNKTNYAFTKAVVSSVNSVLVGEVAKVMKQSGIDIGQNRLFEWLRDKGFLGKSGNNYNLPTQKSMDMGVMEIKKDVVTNKKGKLITTFTPKVTGKGQVYFLELIKKAGYQ